MTFTNQPQTLFIRHGHDPCRYNTDNGHLSTFELNTTDDLICSLADCANNIGAELRFGYRFSTADAQPFCVVLWHDGHPDWIGAFVNRLVVDERLHRMTKLILLSNFIIRTQEYTTEDMTYSWEENPRTKVRYRLLLTSVRTADFLDAEGEERIDLNDYVDREVLL